MHLTCCTLLAWWLASLVFADSAPTVHFSNSNVTYRGSLSSSFEDFQNVRYAHDTSGRRRFAPPEPFFPAKGSVVDASSPGLACPQLQDAVPPFFDAVAEISEDCLNMRITRPKGTSASDSLPVLVWVHGGGIIRGAAYDSHFDPSNLLEQSVASGKPVIFVSIQFRLSIFGFARLEPLQHAKSLNVGLRDQRAAFEWLKEHVAGFGGNPDSITAFGQSAGGTMLSLQTFAFGGQQGLPFDQGWAMSGPPGTSLNIDTDLTTGHTKNVAKQLGCTSSDEEKILACLRKKPMLELIQTAMKYSVDNHPPMGLFTFLPSVDGDFFPAAPSKLIRDGRFVKGVPMVLGWTQDDGAMNAGPAPLVNSLDDMIGPIRSFASQLSDDEVKILIAAYPSSDFKHEVDAYDARKGPDAPPVSARYFALSRLLRDLLFTCPSLDFSYQMMKQSRLERSYKSRFDGVRIYDLDQSPFTQMWSQVGMPWVTISHGSDIPYAFNGVLPEAPMSEDDQKLAKNFAASILAFAWYSVPVSDGSRGDIAFQAWPAAFEAIDNNDENTMPSHFNLQVIGGKRVAQSARVINSTSNRHDAPERHTEYVSGLSDSLGLGMIQDVLSGGFGRVSKDEGPSPELDRSIAAEKLFERCALINGMVSSLRI